jgi:hypothetical protein
VCQCNLYKTVGSVISPNSGIGAHKGRFQPQTPMLSYGKMESSASVMTAEIRRFVTETVKSEITAADIRRLVTETVKSEVSTYFNQSRNLSAPQKALESQPSRALQPTLPHRVRFSSRQLPSRTGGQRSDTMRSTIDEKWGLLFDTRGHPTPRLGQLLRGIANYIVSMGYISPHSLISSRSGSLSPKGAS